MCPPHQGMKGKEDAAEPEKSADKGKDAEDGDAKNLPDKVSLSS